MMRGSAGVASEGHEEPRESDEQQTESRRAESPPQRERKQECTEGVKKSALAMFAEMIADPERGSAAEGADRLGGSAPFFFGDESEQSGSVGGVLELEPLLRKVIRVEMGVLAQRRDMALKVIDNQGE